MIGFSYIYKSSDEILNSISHLSSMGLGDILGVISAVIIAISCIFIIFPSLIIILEYVKQQEEKRNKKKILTQILLQKEIEDEVEKEIQIQGVNEKI